jgi:hypothetical protein
MDAGAWISTQLVQHSRPLTGQDFRAKWGDEAGDAYASLLEARAAMDRLVELVRKGDLKPNQETTDE